MENKLNGRWQAHYAEMAAVPLPAQITQTLLLTITDERYEMQNDSGTIRYVDDDKLEITGAIGPNAGKTIKAVYAFAAPELNICYNLAGDSWPDKFVTLPDTKQFLVKYRITN